MLIPVSKDTILRTVRAQESITGTSPRVIGTNDWVWKHGHRYGTIVCDLERHHLVDVLPDREAATVEVWLASHRGIEVVSRDRGGGYGQGVTRARPDVSQVADR